MNWHAKWLFRLMFGSDFFFIAIKRKNKRTRKVHWEFRNRMVYLRWCHGVSWPAVPLCSASHDRGWRHVNCTYAVHRSYCNCVVERIEPHLRCHPIAFASIESMSSSCPNLWIVRMSNEHPNSDAQLNNRCKWTHRTLPMTTSDSSHCNQNMSANQTKWINERVKLDCLFNYCISIKTMLRDKLLRFVVLTVNWLMRPRARERASNFNETLFNYLVCGLSTQSMKYRFNITFWWSTWTCHFWILDLIQYFTVLN